MPKKFISQFWLKHKNKIILLIIGLSLLDGLIFSHIKNEIFNDKATEIYFFDVGEGDSELIKLSSRIKILIDGGPPNGRLLKNLDHSLPFFNRYLDLVILSHPQLDHFGGLIEVLKRERIGAFIFNAKRNETNSFLELLKVISQKNIPVITVASGDKIHYLNNQLNIVWPPSSFSSNNLNETALVTELKTFNLTTLFTADIDSKIEKKLLSFYHFPLDILKVAHHGSRFSSSWEFLNALKPKIAVIEVGKNNYGHPAKEVLEKLKTIGANIFETDKGTIKLSIKNDKIKIFQNPL